MQKFPLRGREWQGRAVTGGEGFDEQWTPVSVDGEVTGERYQGHGRRGQVLNGVDAVKDGLQEGEAEPAVELREGVGEPVVRLGRVLQGFEQGGGGAGQMRAAGGQSGAGTHDWIRIVEEAGGGPGPRRPGPGLRRSALGGCRLLRERYAGGGRRGERVRRGRVPSVAG